jgi:DNA-binding MarR family transcriptional regulator
MTATARYTAFTKSTDGYVAAIGLIQQIEHRVREAIAIELDRHDIGLEPAQALILYRLGADETAPTELRTRGYYLGSNVSYNLKKLVEMGLIAKRRSDADQRSTRVKATAKGQEIGELVAAQFARQARNLAALGDLREQDVAALNAALRRLYGFLTEQIAYRQI